jgi:hypothetical protein
VLQKVIQNGGECESHRKMSPHEWQGEGLEMQGKLLKYLLMVSIALPLGCL